MNPHSELRLLVPLSAVDERTSWGTVGKAASSETQAGSFDPNEPTQS